MSGVTPPEADVARDPPGGQADRPEAASDGGGVEDVEGAGEFRVGPDERDVAEARSAARVDLFRKEAGKPSAEPVGASPCRFGPAGQGEGGDRPPRCGQEGPFPAGEPVVGSRLVAVQVAVGVQVGDGDIDEAGGPRIAGAEEAEHDGHERGGVGPDLDVVVGLGEATVGVEGAEDTIPDDGAGALPVAPSGEGTPAAGDPHGPVEHEPAADVAAEQASGLAELPDARRGLWVFGADMIGEATDEGPDVVVEGTAGLDVDGDGLDGDTPGVVLQLAAGGVPDPDRTAAPPAGDAGHLALWEALYRAVLGHYGWVRLGSNVVAHLDRIS